jgi:hypothetical protein
LNILDILKVVKESKRAAEEKKAAWLRCDGRVSGFARWCSFGRRFAEIYSSRGYSDVEEFSQLIDT